MPKIKSKTDHIEVSVLNSKRVQAPPPLKPCIRCQKKCLPVQETKFCDKCESEYLKFHPSAFSPNEQPDSDNPLEEREPYHKSQKSHRLSLSQDARLKPASKFRSKKRKSFSVTSKQKSILKLAPLASPEVYESFRYAFFTKRMQYAHSLHYTDDTPSQMNDASMEPHLQNLSKDNCKILKQSRELK